MDHLQKVLSCPCLSRALLTVGTIYSTYLILRVMYTVISVIKTFGGGKDLRQYGSWAIVTGGTDGIGKAISKQLASQKINILLISRNPDKLTSVSKEISEKYNVEVKTETLDMSSTTPEDYEKLSKSYGNLDIGIIVNNVGLSYDHPEYLDTADSQRLWNLLHINIVPCTMLTRAFLKIMTNKRKGLVVNVSSMSSILSTPFLSVYGASKAYVNTLTESLRQEYADMGIHFQVICPMFVSTAMTGMRPSLMCPVPDKYAKSCVATFGNTDFTCGYWPHSLQTTLVSFAPRIWLDSHQKKVMKKGRARWYKKQEAKKE